MIKKNEENHKMSLIDKIDKKQLVTITIGIIVISLLLSAYFIYVAQEALQYEEDLLDRIEALKGANDTLNDNNKVLKDTLEANKQKDPDQESVIDDDLVGDETYLDTITKTAIGESYPSDLDDLSKTYLDKSYINAKVLLYAYTVKLNSGEYPDGFSELVELRHIYFIDKNHCFVQLVEGDFSANIIYEIDTSTGEIKFNEIAYDFQVEENKYIDKELPSLINHLVVRSLLNVETMEISDTQVFDTRFIGGRISPNGKFAVQLSIVGLVEGTYDIFPVVKDLETGREKGFSTITNQSSGVGDWKQDSSKVLIDETRIYDVISNEIINIAPIDKEHLIVEPKTQTYDNVIVTKDYIGIIEIYNIRETFKSQVMLHIYDWNGQFLNNLMVYEYNTPNDARPVSIISSNVSLKNNIVAIEPQTVLNAAYMIDLDQLSIKEISRNLIFIPDLEWYAQLKQEVNNNVITEIAEFYNLEGELMLRAQTGDKRIEDYFGKDSEKDLLYFRRYTDNGYSDITAINYVSGELSEIAIPHKQINENSTVIPYGYINGFFEIIEIISTDANSD